MVHFFLKALGIIYSTAQHVPQVVEAYRRHDTKYAICAAFSAAGEPTVQDGGLFLVGSEGANFSFGCVDICLHDLRMPRMPLLCACLFLWEKKSIHRYILCLLKLLQSCANILAVCFREGLKSSREAGS